MMTAPLSTPGLLNPLPLPPGNGQPLPTAPDDDAFARQLQQRRDDAARHDDRPRPAEKPAERPPESQAAERQATERQAANQAATQTQAASRAAAARARQAAADQPQARPPASPKPAEPEAADTAATQAAQATEATDDGPAADDPAVVELAAWVMRLVAPGAAAAASSAAGARAEGLPADAANPATAPADAAADAPGATAQAHAHGGGRGARAGGEAGGGFRAALEAQAQAGHADQAAAAEAKDAGAAATPERAAPAAAARPVTPELPLPATAGPERSGPAATDATAPVLAQASVDTPVDHPGFGAALGARLTMLARDGVQEARLSLNPAEMGPISVQIALDGSAAHIDFHAAADATRGAIEASLPALAGALREAGLTLAGGGVFQQSAGSGQNRGGDTPARPGSSRRGDDADASMQGVAAAARPQPRRLGGLDLYA